MRPYDEYEHSRFFFFSCCTEIVSNRDPRTEVRTEPWHLCTVCMYVCMYACMHVCMYACMHVCMHVCMYACMHVCMYACMHACMHVCMYEHIHTVAVVSWNEHYRGSKTTNCILSNTNYDYRGRLIKTFLQFLAKYYIMASEHFYHGAWFLNQEILIVASHIQLHIYDFSNMVNLLGSSPGTALHLWCGAAINTMKRVTTLEDKLKWHGCFSN